MFGIENGMYRSMFESSEMVGLGGSPTRKKKYAMQFDLFLYPPYNGTPANLKFRGYKKWPHPNLKPFLLAKNIFEVICFGDTCKSLFKQLINIF